MKILKKIFIIVVLLAIPYSLVPSPSHAQQVSLSISPPLIDAIIRPGKSIMIAYTLKNFGDPVFLTTRIAGFEPRDNLGNIRLKDEAVGPVRFGLDNADLKLGQSFFLKTGQIQQLLLRMRLPEGVPDGDHNFSLLVETVPPTTVEGLASSRSRATIASNILITVTDSGAVDVKPKITLFETLSGVKFILFGKSIRIFDSFDKIPIVLYIENRGANRFTPRGELVLRGAFGQTAEYEILPSNVLASSQRLLEATPSAEIQPIVKQPPKTLVLSGFFVGRYGISANINFGENSPAVFASTSFFAIPFKIILALLGLITATVFITRRLSEKD